jgi:FtsP/CotA-like multicopper oxidase with cupredoxin domain
MKKHLLTAALLAGVFGSGSATAAPAVHPFEAPPTLGQSEPLSLAALGQPQRSGRCTPSGSQSRDKSVVSVRLEFVRSRFFINNPDPSDPQPNHEDPVELRSYGGCKAGPVIEVVPGDTLRTEFFNRTSTNDVSCSAYPPAGLGVPPGVGCYNTTNLHTHGLHVSPSGNSDNVLLDIAPQTSFPFEVNIPADHPSGTFWYHAHRHGSTAVNVASGASGVLIIRGKRPYPDPKADIDTILHDRAGKPLVEQIFLFQQIAYACFRNDPANPAADWQQMYTSAGLNNVTISNNLPSNPTNYSPWTCPLSSPGAPVSPGVVENFQLQLDSPSIWDTNGRFTSINGIVQPTLTVPAGQIQRWRFVHAGIHDTINLQVVRAAPVGGRNLIRESALEGNRQQQKADVVAACPATEASLIPQFEYAADGLTRVHMNTIKISADKKLQSNYLQPGYRSDILVAFPEEGDYCLLDQAAPASQRINPKTGQGNGGQGPDTPQVLAYVHVRGGKTVTTDLETYVRRALFDANSQLPEPVRGGLLQGILKPWAPFVTSPPATGLQQAAFAITNSPSGATLFQVNGQSYDPSVVNITRQVNTTDDWVLTANGEPHIFHIHVNPFEIVDVTVPDKNGNQISIYDANGNCTALASGDSQELANQYCGMQHVFKDTVFVENGFQVHIRTTYLRYIGEYVLHCHILDHEDGGMMLNVSIVPDISSATHGLGMAKMGHH